MPFIEFNAILLAFLLANIAVENLIIGCWLGYLTYEFQKQSRTHNGITRAITLAFLALSIDRLWSIQVSTYNALHAVIDVFTGDYPQPDNYRLFSLLLRFLSLLFIIIAAYILSQRLRRENHQT